MCYLIAKKFDERGCIAIEAEHGKMLSALVSYLGRKTLDKGIQILTVADMNTENDNSDMLRGIPVWGNWCGPGYGSGEPIDLLDEGCRQHDNCYVHGGNNCKCNRKLINYINKNIGKMTGGQKRVAKAVKLYFQAENRVKGC